MKSSLLRACVVVVAMVPMAALAHTDHGQAYGFWRGIMHPIGGLDHVLAMVGVGALAASVGGRAVWALPASFLAMMSVGALVGYFGIALPYVEVGIALSVVALGLLLATRLGLPLAAVVALVAVFAVFHGHAHGAEAPAGSSEIGYGIGFLVATATLHAAGICAAMLLSRLRPLETPRALQAAGAAMSIAGLGLLAGWM